MLYKCGDVYDLFLEFYVIVLMILYVVGIWLLYCYVNVYNNGGMNVFFIVMVLLIGKYLWIEILYVEIEYI